MCAGSGFSSAKYNLVGRVLGGSNYKKADPLMGNLEQQEARYTAPPQMPTPAQPQAAKEPDTSTLRAARQRRGFGTGTMLTGSSGVDYSSLNTGGATLLGG